MSSIQGNNAASNRDMKRSPMELLQNIAAGYSNQNIAENIS